MKYLKNLETGLTSRLIWGWVKIKDGSFLKGKLLCQVIPSPLPLPQWGEEKRKFLCIQVIHLSNHLSAHPNCARLSFNLTSVSFSSSALILTFSIASGFARFKKS